jgi:ubiquinone/menaquinone biosynthesis C-methylase UbiE
VSEPYASRDLWGAIEGALRVAGKDPQRLASEEIAALDHFHTGGLQASRALLGLLPTSGVERVLDLGAGIGGGSRFLAEHTVATVVSLDPSQAFCQVNRRLSAATGLAPKVEVVLGDGLALPFANSSFDIVWMQQAAMNIDDKALLAGEIARVLHSGGSYVFQEVAAGENPGPLELPVAWAAEQGDSHLESGSRMRELLAHVGMREIVFEDITAALLPGLRERVQAVEANGPPVLGVHLLSTSDMGSILRGMLLSVEARRIAFVRGAFRAA